MTDTAVDKSIKEKILKLEALKEALLNEDDVIWDEVNAAQRDLSYLKRVLGCYKK
jgi:hypothetical protein|tara:strand:+ start:1080 stop:1244 length:165 start_codon:yes stop_codon:yes gene_type:complete